ncbi:MAG: mechanosensitive ion channel [Rhodospirillales bacterium]|nr:mechanosensitive ion channel [Rhodospirillales bacterium]
MAQADRARHAPAQARQAALGELTVATSVRRTSLTQASRRRASDASADLAEPCEEITGAYVVLKVWDWRRLVVPLSYFLEKPFQNWTLQGTDLIGSVFLWVDYTVPVADVRSKLEDIVRTTRLWSGDVVNLQVVETNEQAVQLRALVSARTSEQAWDLRCEVREKLIAFLQQTYPTALPKQRAELVELERPAGRPRTAA